MATAAYQKNLFSKRWQGVRLPTLSEQQLQINLVTELRWRLRSDVEFYHVPNGGLRNKREAAKLKAMATMPGVPDLTFRWGPPLQLLYLELKAKGGKLRPEQLNFGERARAHGAHFAVADNIPDAISIIQSHGLLK